MLRKIKQLLGLANKAHGQYQAIAASPTRNQWEAARSVRGEFHFAPRTVSELQSKAIMQLQEECRFLEQVIDDEYAFTYGMDGTVNSGLPHGQAGPPGGLFNYAYAYGQGFMRPSYTSCFYINEAQLRIMRARSRAFCSQNPYWHGITHARKVHVVGKGPGWMASWRDRDKAENAELVRKVQKELDDFRRDNRYREVQKEKLERKGRDGEYFLSMFEQDGKMRVKFLEPLLVWTPPGHGPHDGCWFGIQFQGDDYERPVGYYVRRPDYLGGDEDAIDPAGSWERMIPAEYVQRRCANVDRSSPRGVPDTYWVQTRLNAAVKILGNMGTLVDFRSKIALIRQRVNALAGSVQGYLSRTSSATIAGPGGQTRNIQDYPEGTILDIDGQSTYTFPSQNIETDKIVSAVQADLQSVATASGMADYMVSGNLGSSSYSSTMVAEGPVVKTFEDMQEDMIEEDQEVVQRCLQIAVDAGRLPAEALDVIEVVMKGSDLAGRNKIQDAQARQIEKMDGGLSETTWLQETGRNPETERANRAMEAEAKAKQDSELREKYGPPEEAAGPDGGGNRGGGGGDSRGTQARNRATSNARPVKPDDEGRQKKRVLTEEEEEAFGEFLESSHEYGGRHKPTVEDVRMASKLITPEWLEKTKQEIMSLPQHTVLPRFRSDTLGEYEPGVKGEYMGVVDGQQVWACDMVAIAVKHDAPDLRIGANTERSPWLPADRIVVDWSQPIAEMWHILLHEVIEYVLMKAGWSYARAHNYSNRGPGCEGDWILEIRPELKHLRPERDGSKP